MLNCGDVRNSTGCIMTIMTRGGEVEGEGVEREEGQESFLITNLHERKLSEFSDIPDWK